MNWRHWSLGFLSTFVAAVLGVIVAEYLIARVKDSESSDSPSYQEYTNVVLLASRVQPTGVYVRYRNAGTNTLNTACFKFKYYEKATQLVEESVEWYSERVVPGATTEGIITPERFRNGDVIPISMKGRTVTVICTGGYTD